MPVGGGIVLAAQDLVVTQPVAGTFKGFSATCTHQGCKVNEVAGGTINCPCHGSKFAVADGAPTAGPAKQAAAGEGGDGGGELPSSWPDVRRRLSTIHGRGNTRTMRDTSAAYVCGGAEEGRNDGDRFEQEPTALLVVAGAHLRGEPLHPSLLALGARFVRATRTAPEYRMVALPALDEEGGRPAVPPRPGLVRDPAGGEALEVEIYELPSPPSAGCCSPWRRRSRSAPWRWPTASAAPGFVCEGYAAGSVPDISAYGGWRGYLGGRHSA